MCICKLCKLSPLVYKSIHPFKTERFSCTLCISFYLAYIHVLPVFAKNNHSKNVPLKCWLVFNEDSFHLFTEISYCMVCMNYEGSYIASMRWWNYEGSYIASMRWNYEGSYIASMRCNIPIIIKYYYFTLSNLAKVIVL